MLERLIKDKMRDLFPKNEIDNFLERLESVRFPNNPLDDLIEKVRSNNTSFIPHVQTAGCVKLSIFSVGRA